MSFMEDQNNVPVRSSPRKAQVRKKLQGWAVYSPPPPACTLALSSPSVQNSLLWFSRSGHRITLGTGACSGSTSCGICEMTSQSGVPLVGSRTDPNDQNLQLWLHQQQALNKQLSKEGSHSSWTWKSLQEITWCLFRQRFYYVHLGKWHL